MQNFNSDVTTLKKKCEILSIDSNINSNQIDS